MMTWVHFLRTWPLGQQQKRDLEKLPVLLCFKHKSRQSLPYELSRLCVPLHPPTRLLGSSASMCIHFDTFRLRNAGITATTPASSCILMCSQLGSSIICMVFTWRQTETAPVEATAPRLKTCRSLSIARASTCCATRNLLSPDLTSPSGANQKMDATLTSWRRALGLDSDGSWRSPDSERQS